MWGFSFDKKKYEIVAENNLWARKKKLRSSPYLFFSLQPLRVKYRASHHKCITFSHPERFRKRNRLQPLASTSREASDMRLQSASDNDCSKTQHVPNPIAPPRYATAWRTTVCRGGWVGVSPTVQATVVGPCYATEPPFCQGSRSPVCDFIWQSSGRRSFTQNSGMYQQTIWSNVMPQNEPAKRRAN